MTDPAPGIGVLAALAVLIAASVWLGFLAERVVDRGAFMKSFFLGNRGLGPWAMALTATVQSGGTFMGFPSFVYTHGWAVSLWIASYMVVPITGFGVLGKRFAQLSRRTGALTVPDLLRERFASPTVGLIASIFILFYMTFMLVAQFKAGALIMKIAWPGTGALALSEDGPIGPGGAYYLGLAIFTLTVVGYTLIGGFLAAVWTDLFQSVMMFIGVMILLPLVLMAAGGTEAATRAAMASTGPEFVFPPGYSPEGRQFLPLSLAFSFFVLWIFSGVGAPASMVRVMACRDTPTLRRSIALLGVYNTFIYLPLIMICVCGRAVIPSLEVSDEIIPRLALKVTHDFWGGGLLAGVILAAPFGAVMSTVSSYLVVIASGLVRDIYQRFLHPEASDARLKWLARAVMIVVGLIAVGANIQPVDFLQAIVVFSASGSGATFFVAAVMAAYWRRATAKGAIAAMLAGSGVTLFFYSLSWIAPYLPNPAVLEPFGYYPMIGAKSAFRPCFPFGLDPIVFALAASALAGVIVSLCTQPPGEHTVSRLFDAPEPKGSRA